MKVKVVPAPAHLKRDVECFRVSEHNSEERLAIKIVPKALPGIVFQHDNGRSAVESIVTPSHTAQTPTLFLHGAITEASVMNYRAGAYTSIQVILKPHALRSLFGLDAGTLANGSVEVNEFAVGDLNLQLMEANDTAEQINQISHFLCTQLKRERTRDELVEASLRLIHGCPAEMSVKSLLDTLSLSERHFERRFRQTVGVSPRTYIRTARVNEAIRLIKTGQHNKLTDIAYALGYYDQSHFIRDIKTLSGRTPKDIAGKQGDSYHDQLGYSYV